jgi:hypothetical protein
MTTVHVNNPEGIMDGDLQVAAEVRRRRRRTSDESQATNSYKLPPPHVGGYKLKSFEPRRASL